MVRRGAKKNQPTPSKQIGKTNTVLIKSSEQRDEANVEWNWNKNQNLTSSYFVELSSRLNTRLDSKLFLCSFEAGVREKKWKVNVQTVSSFTSLSNPPRLEIFPENRSKFEARFIMQLARPRIKLKPRLKDTTRAFDRIQIDGNDETAVF